MRSIVHNGIDLSEWCSAEVVEKVALPVVPDTMVVPGRAGALLVSGRIPPKQVRVRLFMDAGFRPGTNGLADIRHRVYSALCSTAGGTLRLPDEPELEYRRDPSATRAMTAQTRPSPARARRLTRARARLPSKSRWAARRLPGRSYSPSTTSRARLVRPGRKVRRGRRERRPTSQLTPPSSTWTTPSPRSPTSKRRSSDGRRHRFHEHPY